MSSEFGIYRLSYTPTQWYDPAYVEPTIDMSISGEADLSQMLSFFDSFLRASGYILDGKEVALTDIKTHESYEPPQPSWQWQGSTVSSVSKDSAPAVK